MRRYCPFQLRSFSVQSWFDLDEAVMEAVQMAKNRAVAFAQQGRLAEAAACFQQVLQQDPDDHQTHSNLGIVLLFQDRLDEAGMHFQKALTLKPDNPELHFNLGYVLHRRGQLDRATPAYRHALKLRPNHVDALNNLGSVLLDQRQLEEAESSFRAVLQHKPDHVDAMVNLGIAVMELGRLDEAANLFRQALRLAPNVADAHNGLGAVYMKQAKIREALASYDESLRREPNHADTHLNRALLWLLLGDWQRGWREYEWRWRTKAFPPLAVRQPRWDGSPLAGRTLLVLAEQGLGDTLQFIRYLSLPPLRDSQVIFRCPKPLLTLLKQCSYLPRLIAEGEKLPSFDVYAPLLSLPGILGTSPNAVPANIPYLEADSTLVSQWRGQLGSAGRRIGIAWQGSTTHRGDRLRSIPLAQFRTLAEIDGVQLVSLQKGPGTEQLRSLAGQLDVVDLENRWGDEAESMGHIAAIMKSLDLVISCDSAIAHLAGALGVPVWIALPQVPDWRWQLEREDSPWYPTARLFRQSAMGDWESVLQKMAAEVKRNSFRSITT
jgi:Flp pilus assembly protein TadD